jgi:hypothetical protein
VGFVVDKVEWHRERFFSVLLDFPLLLSYPRGFPYSCAILGMNNKPVVGCTAATYSHPVDINNNNNPVEQTSYPERTPI